MRGTPATRRRPRAIRGFAACAVLLLTAAAAAAGDAQRPGYTSPPCTGAETAGEAPLRPAAAPSRADATGAGERACPAGKPCTPCRTSPVTAWRIDGAQNRVYLLGSVHLLRKQDHPLPAVIEDLYREAETLVMEMDVDDIDMAQAQALIRELGTIEGDGRLAGLMGPAAWARAESLASEVHIPLGALQSSEPWLAAITVEQLMLARIGFDPAYGIENHLAGKAQADGKEVRGLEALREQLGFLDGMSLEAQRQLLLQSLEESAGIETLMEDLVRAWRYGDIETLERQMLAEVRDYPELYDALVVERNHRWAETIAGLAQEADDYLVVVGALHLVGEDGLPALLEELGYEPVQLCNAQISTISKSSLPAPQSGHRHDNGTSSQRVPGGIPDCGSPSASS